MANGVLIKMKNYHISQTLTFGLLTFIIAFFVFGITASRADIYEESYPVNGGSGELVPLGGQKMYYVSIGETEVQSNAIITNVEARFRYTAYDGVEQHLSCRFNRGSDPYSSGGVALVGFDQPYPPDSNGGPATLSYKSFNTWNGSPVNSTYYFRFFRDSVDPPSYEPTIFNVEVRITYVLPSSAPILYTPDDYSIRYNQTPHSFDWSDASGADRYRIYVDNHSGFGSPEINEEPSSSQLTSYTNLSNNVYYWKVQARNSAGQWGDWSVTRRFVVDTPPPSPSLSS